MLLAISMLFNVIAYRGVTYQTGIVMGALPYIYVIVWERIFFRQKLNLKKIAGAALIIFGICIYAL